MLDKLRSQSVAVSVGITSGVGIEAANARESITFCPPTAGRYSVQFGGAAVLDSGLTIIAGMTPVTVTRDTLGDDLLAGVSFIGSGALTVGVLVVNGTCCRREFE